MERSCRYRHERSSDFTTILPHFQEHGNIRFSDRISYLLDIRESGLFSATMFVSHSIAA